MRLQDADDRITMSSPIVTLIYKQISLFHFLCTPKHKQISLFHFLWTPRYNQISLFISYVHQDTHKCIFSFLMDIDQDTNTQDTNKYMYLFFISYELCFFPNYNSQACMFIFVSVLVCVVQCMEWASRASYKPHLLKCVNYIVNMQLTEYI